jgi:hypothetical protein
MSIRSYRIKNIIVFLIFFFLYIINRIFKKYITIPIIGYICKNYLNDFIGGLIFCIYVNMILVIAKKKPISNICLLILFMLFVSIIWEFVFPIFLSYSTSDIYDVVAYILGTFIYYLIFRKDNRDIII